MHFDQRNSWTSHYLLRLYALTIERCLSLIPLARKLSFNRHHFIFVVVISGVTPRRLTPPHATLAFFHSLSYSLIILSFLINYDISSGFFLLLSVAVIPSSPLPIVSVVVIVFFLNLSRQCAGAISVLLLIVAWWRRIDSWVAIRIICFIPGDTRYRRISRDLVGVLNLDNLQCFYDS